MASNTAPGVEIKYDGKPLSKQMVGLISDVAVESCINLPGSFAVTLMDASLAAVDSKDGQFHEGVKLEIALGYNQKFRLLMTGEISAVSAQMSAQGIFTRVTGFDMLHRLSRGTNYKRFESGTGEALADSVIAQTLLNDAGLKPTVDTTPERSIPRVQDNRSDLDFLTMLARLNGFYLYSEGDRGFFSESAPNGGEQTLSWGKNLRSFYPKINLNGLVNTLEVRGWDTALDESFVETKDRPRDDLLMLSSAGRDMMDRGSGGHSALNLHDALITSSDDAKRFLPAAMQAKQAVAFASGSCAGNMELVAGTKLKIEGTGRFSGNYLVTRAVHRFNSGGYTTEFDARMTP